MANLVISRSDLWPVGTSCSLFPAAQRPTVRGPGDVEAGPVGSAAAISTATVDAAGVLTLASAVAGVAYVVHGAPGGVNRYVNRIQ
jgi:hypothetical protein